MPLPHAPVLQDPQHQCMLVNAWLLAAASVALPLALLWRMERRGRRLLGQPAAPPRRHLPTPLQGAWPSLMCAYLESCLLWCAASIGMFAWLSAQPGGLAQLAW